MRHRTIFVLVFLVLLGLFAGLNWTLFNTPASLNLLFTQTQAPLGQVMLIIIAVLTVLYLLFTAGIEGAALIEVRRYARDLHTTRRLAENQEESRFNQLEKLLHSELSTLKSQHEDQKVYQGELAQQHLMALREEVSKLHATQASTEQRLAETVERAANTIAAYLGEVESRLGRSGEEEKEE